MKRLFALLVAAVLMAGVVSAYADDASSMPGQVAGTTGADVAQPKEVKKVKKAKKHHHKAGKKKTRKSKVTRTETSEPAVN